MKQHQQQQPLQSFSSQCDYSAAFLFINNCIQRSSNNGTGGNIRLDIISPPGTTIGNGQLPLLHGTALHSRGGRAFASASHTVEKKKKKMQQTGTAKLPNARRTRIVRPIWQCTRGTLAAADTTTAGQSLRLYSRPERTLHFLLLGTLTLSLPFSVPVVF